MASPVTLNPNGNGTFPLNWSGTGSPAGNYTEVADSLDTTWGACGGDSQSSYYLFEDLPGEAVTVTGCDYSWRTADSGKSPARKFTTIQLVQSNESTALTNAADVSSTTSSATTQTGSFTLTGATDAATWNGLRIKMTTGSSGTGAAYVYKIQLTVYYSTAAADNPAVIGIVFGSGNPSVPAGGNIWLVRPPSAYERFATRIGKPLHGTYVSREERGRRSGFDIWTPGADSRKILTPFEGGAGSLYGVVHPDGHGGSFRGRSGRSSVR